MRQLARKPSVTEADYLSVSEYACERAVSEKTVRRLLKAGRLPGAHLVGAQWRIPKGAVPLERGQAGGGQLDALIARITGLSCVHCG